ncbi:ATP-binding protein [Gluconacetobacter tumulisoli]|uniref:ATP-binding protein n=1 Tax=Gluconacetobacter tumulisoli TaxID=1286189 RepID=A0A7W4K6G0_9PROT|nr:ATP-binding protein [Gluconacetobacter tumulisoli]MBB2201137.1 ATP-binding protein [Gluconacetobacter tumulisoli]
MSDTFTVSALRVANESFLVASMIERCPKTMMIRELVVNGIEAAANAPAGQRKIHIDAQRINDATKLCIWNTGPGLSPEELLRITDLASSLRKENSLDKNFGMGAKVASLPSNRYGLRYRSCKAGRVSEVMLGQRNGVYGRLRQGSDGQEVIDVSDQVRAEGLYDLDQDWTEVLLLGNSAEQNTVLSPYDESPRVGADWLPRYLEQRFFRLPARIDVLLSPDVTARRGTFRLRGMVDRLAGFQRIESVTTPNNIILHYGFHAPSGVAPGTSGNGQSAIVHRGEMYDVTSRKSWAREAPIFGIPFGAAFISVFVELPDDYPVWPEAYRQFLRFRGGDQKQVFMVAFAPVVRTFMPDWLKQLIQSLGPQQAEYLDEINDELRDLLAELEVPPSNQGQPAGYDPAPPPSPPKPSKPTTDRANQPSRELPLEQPPREQPPRPREDEPEKPRPRTYERPPEIIGLRDEALIAERGLNGRAAKYFPQSHQLFLNLTYPAVADLAERLAQGAAMEDPTQDEEALRLAAIEVAEWCITRKISRALVYSLAKRGAGWHPEEVNRAQSPECLTLVADDWHNMLDIGQRRLATTLPTYVATSMTQVG